MHFSSNASRRFSRPSRTSPAQCVSAELAISIEHSMSAVNFALGALAGAAATAVAADAYPSMMPSLGFSRPKDIELKYFDIAGAAEKVRFTLLMGGVPFKDTRVSFGDWGKMKETTKFGQLPLMYLNGEEKPYAQSGPCFGSRSNHRFDAQGSRPSVQG